MILCGYVIHCSRDHRTRRGHFPIFVVNDDHASILHGYRDTGS